MTLDSLVKTFSVTLALLVINEMSSQPPRSKSIVDIENEIS